MEQLQSFRPSLTAEPLLYKNPWGRNAPRIAGPNDGGIKRGDREDTGDNQADLDELSPGGAHASIDPTAIGGKSSISPVPVGGFDTESELEQFDGMEIMSIDDGRLGLTDVGDIPADDWAADTGPDKAPLGS